MGFPKLQPSRRIQNKAGLFSQIGDQFVVLHPEMAFFLDVGHTILFHVVNA